jgi:peptidoglycan/xylan/chitin deacetylase (PgdA/CDA1 family)
MTHQNWKKGSYLPVAASREAHGIMFHYFHGNGHPVVQGSMGGEDLADMVEFIGGRANILPANDWIEKALKGSLKRDELCLTFDDGILAQKDVALPVLESIGLTAMFFVYSSVFLGGQNLLEVFRAFRTGCFESIDEFYERFFEAIEKSEYASRFDSGISGFDPNVHDVQYPFYSEEDRRFRYARDHVIGVDAYNEIMTQMIQETTSIQDLSDSLWMRNEDLVELADAGHVVGLHSYSHPTTLNQLTLEDQRTEYEQNIEHLTDLLGVRPFAVSHPCNAYDAVTLAVLEDLGVKIGFTDNMRMRGGGALEFIREDQANVLAMMEGKR